MALSVNDKILFKQGTQEKLNSLNTSIVGAFYLTNDTHRLYIGEDAAKGPVPVNQGLLTVEKVEDLKNISGDPGQFYLVTQGNILCIYSKGEWVQINTDTVLDHLKQSIALEGDVATVTTVVGDTSDNSNEVTDTFNLEAGAGIKFATKEIEESDGTKTYQLVISSTGAGDITVAQTAKQGADDKEAIIVTTTTVTAPGQEQGDSTPKEFSVKAGTYIDSIIAEDKAITINAQSAGLSAAAVTPQATGYKLGIDQDNHSGVEADFDPIIVIGETGTEVHFENNKATLSVYSINEVNTKIEQAIQTADAMTFVGVATSALPAITELHNGDTYKVGSTAVTFPAGAVVEGDASSLRVGDLIIAVGDENDDTHKIIDNANAKYVIIPSGNEDEVIGDIETAHTVKVKYNDNNQTVIAGIALQEGTQIKLTDSDNEQVKTITVDHASITTKDTDASDTAYATDGGQLKKTITVVKELAVNNGHVTEVTTAEETITDTQIKSFGATVASSGNGATVTHVVADTNANSTEYTSDFAIESTGSLKISTSGNTITADLYWGEF